jgi:hypothetical protein
MNALRSGREPLKRGFTSISIEHPIIAHLVAIVIGALMFATK